MKYVFHKNHKKVKQTFLKCFVEKNLDCNYKLMKEDWYILIRKQQNLSLKIYDKMFCKSPVLGNT